MIDLLILIQSRAFNNSQFIEIINLHYYTVYFVSFNVEVYLFSFCIRYLTFSQFYYVFRPTEVCLFSSVFYLLLHYLNTRN